MKDTKNTEELEMKNILLINKKSDTITGFEVEYKKHLNDNVVFVAEDNIHRNLCRLDFKESDTFRIITVEELLDGEVDDMRFDKVVGNIPYTV